jgi:ATP-binding cassette subfamily F protein uup
MHTSAFHCVSTYRELQWFHVLHPMLLLLQVESLSGGERRRLHLAAVLASAPNVLILDEPTNDLDLTTIEVLEEMLQVWGFRGLIN